MLQRKGVLVGAVSMILRKSKGGIGRLKLTEIEDLLFGGNCSIGFMYKNEGAPIIL